MTSMFPAAVTTFQNNNHRNNTNTGSNSYYHYTMSNRFIRKSPREDMSPLPKLRLCPRSTAIVDLKYFAKRDCIVPLLAALDTLRLVALSARCVGIFLII